MVGICKALAESAEWSGRWDLNPRPSAWEAEDHSTRWKPPLTRVLVL